MDWVQNKNRSKKNRGKLDEIASQSSQATAAEWFDDLCQEKLSDEKVALLQQSLSPPSSPKSPNRKGDHPNCMQALWWGVAPIQGDERHDADMLTSLIQRITFPANEVPSKLATPEQISNWLRKQLPLRSEEPTVALVAAGWIHGLPELGRELEPSKWIDSLQTILTQVDRAWENKEPESLLAWLIWSCEIPLALAVQLSQLGCKDRVVTDTLDRLALALEAAVEKPDDWLENGGRALRALLACVIRCRWTADRLGARRWFAPQRKAIVQLATSALNATGKDGKPLLVDSDVGQTDAAFWPALLDLARNDKKLANLMAMCLPKELRPKEAKRDREIKLGNAKGLYNETAEIALMRRSWDDAGGRVAIDFSSDPIWLNVLDANGERLLSGWWEIQVNKNGKPLDIDCGWSEVCWYSDKDVDYLELQCEVEGECLIQRQIMLVRDEGLIFTADALIGNSTATWILESRFPLAEGVRLQIEDKTREGKLVHDGESKCSGIVLPLAQPEWKRQPSLGELSEEGESIILVHKEESQRLYSPLVFAIKKKHQELPYTWRQLTVAEELQIIKREVAVAYRVQIGKEHWVAYRSLTPATRRTAVGMHLNSEFYAGRLDTSDGTYEALIQVDTE